MSAFLPPRSRLISTFPLNLQQLPQLPDRQVAFLQQGDDCLPLFGTESPRNPGRIDQAQMIDLL